MLLLIVELQLQNCRAIAYPNELDNLRLVVHFIHVLLYCNGSELKYSGLRFISIKIESP